MGRTFTEEELFYLIKLAHGGNSKSDIDPIDFNSVSNKELLIKLLNMLPGRWILKYKTKTGWRSSTTTLNYSHVLWHYERKIGKELLLLYESLDVNIGFVEVKVA